MLIFKRKVMKQVIITIILLQSSFMLGQNVGIGTNNPSTNLHLKGNIQQIVEVNDGFEDAILDPPFLVGDGDCLCRVVPLTLEVFHFKHQHY